MSDDKSDPLGPTLLKLADTEPLRHTYVDGVHFYLLGTAHVSHKSAVLVTELIETQAFDTVAVELCPSRHQAIANDDAWRDLDIFQLLREGKGGMMMASLAMSAYQRRIAEKLGVEPGAEMKAAISACQSYNTPLWLIDRDIGVTLKRASARLGWWKKWVMLNGLFFSMFSREEISEEEIEALKQGDLLDQTFAQFSEATPELYESLIAERDQYMAAKLRSELGNQHKDHVPKRVLAVVGAGHLAGISQSLKDPMLQPEKRIKSLEELPSTRSIWKLIPWAILALVLTGFAIGFSRSPELGWALIATWVIINGGLSAIGALIARGHPLTVLTALLAAPLTSLNPTVGAGMVTGAVEAWIKKPRVGDFESLRTDIGTLAGWYRNRVSHIFLVFFASNLGSAAGTWIAGLSMIRQLSAGS